MSTLFFVFPVVKQCKLQIKAIHNPNELPWTWKLYLYAEKSLWKNRSFGGRPQDKQQVKENNLIMWRERLLLQQYKPYLFPKPYLHNNSSTYAQTLLIKVHLFI